MKTVFLAGHGEWNIHQNGFTKVPRGIRVQFYTLNMKNMFTADMLSVIEGTYTGKVQDEYEEGFDVPNYTLYPDAAHVADCRTKLRVRNDPDYGLLMVSNGKVATLQMILNVLDPGTTAIWCACRYNKLNEVGGKRIGVNAAQGTYGDKDAQGRVLTKQINPGDRFYFNSTSATPVIKNLQL